MAYYPKEDQETLFGISALDGYWDVYTTIPSHIRKYREIGYDLKEKTDDEGRVIELRCRAKRSQIKFTKERAKRKLSEEQKIKLAERMKLARLKRNENT